MIARVARQVMRKVRDGQRPVRGVRILAYHGVIDERRDPRVDASFHLISEFRAHLALFRRCRVIALVDLEDELSANHRIPAVAITFDDGFRNNLVAADLLARAGLPMTTFVASENVARGEPIWPSLLRLVLARGSARTVQLAGSGYDLDRDPSAFDRVRALFKELADAPRRAMWAELIAQLRDGELDGLTAAFPSIAMLSPSEVRAMHDSGVEIGSHGRLHELHHAAQPAELRHAELVGSRTQIETMIAAPCSRFAYPNGTFHADSPREVRAAGYAQAFTMQPRSARGADDRRLMPRFVPPASVDKLAAMLLFGT